MASTTAAPGISTGKKSSFGSRLIKDILKNRYVYLLALPVIAYYVIFCYIPMYGVTLAFMDFSPVKGYFGSPWIGLKHFTSFFNSYYFTRLLTNTLLLNIYDLLWGFPAPIILALLINELRAKRFKRVVQTISYLPHFVSMVVIAGIIRQFCSADGFVNQIVALFGGTKSDLLSFPELFRTIYISSGIWQGVGFGTIIYLAAISSINPELYDAAYVDGAGRFRQALNVTLPSIMPTVIILLILRIGSMMNVGFEKIILLYSPVTYETADVISTFVYRKGLIESNFSYSTAVGLFNSVINFALLIFANKLSRKVSESSLW